jgi:hypothetical protein
MKHIRPRQAILLPQQKGVATIFCLFVHDGTRRGAKPDDPPGMLMNAMIVESFGVRGGKIHEVEAMPLRSVGIRRRRGHHAFNGRRIIDGLVAVFMAGTVVGKSGDLAIVAFQSIK